MKVFAILLCALCACGGGSEGADHQGSDAGTSNLSRCGPPDRATIPQVSPVLDGRITINEMMASNAVTIADDTGASSDWVELFNPSSQDIPLAGYSLTNVLSEPLLAMIDESIILPAGGHLVLWLDGDPALGPEHMCLTLARDGGALALARPDGTYIDRITYGEQAVDFAAARTPDGSDQWQIEWHVTPGEPNLRGAGNPVEVEDVSVEPEIIPAAGDLTERMLGYDERPELELRIDSNGVASLRDDPRTYVSGELVYDGRAYGPVGVRLKGGNSFQPFDAKPSFRINIDEYVDNAKFFGLDDLTLNNMDDDYSMIHERIAYLVARMIGPASRANHAVLTVNGDLYGLYSNVETVKRHMISRWFEDDTGPLFEATDVDFAEEYIDAYDLESGPDDRSLLTGLAEALTITDADQAIAAASEYANIKQFQKFWAMCSVTGQFDSFPFSNPGDDYFVYADPETNQLWFLPWGMDETFYSSEFDVLQVQSVLARKCLGSPACFQGFVDETWDLLALAEDFGWESERSRVSAQIAAEVARDSRKPYSDATVTEFQMQMRFFLTERRAKLETMLPPKS